MATIVLSYAGAALGTAVGGPLGGAIGRAAGGIIGNIFDQQLFGPGRKRIEGPRLHDLRIMASEEGAAIPAIWGRMRVAGQVIWASNLLEVRQTSTENTSSKGSSGSGETAVTSYTYFANFAVGLCEGEIDRIGRVWADGREIDLSAHTTRLYRGSSTQNPDSLITAVEGAGAVPAYRGLAYIVFERLPLADFGNRIPQLSFEVMRAGNDTADRIKAMCIIPGATEFGYDTLRVARNVGDGESISENAHASATRSDWSVSIDQLTSTCRNLDMASLIVPWFGTDLRCASCNVKPGVDSLNKTTSGSTWKVAGVARASAHEVSRVAGNPAYGGTPSDASVLRAIADLKARGLKVMFYPFILMDVAQGNSLPDPYGGAAQGPYPWRGRITASIAPGRPGTPDKTATAASQVTSFVGTALPSHFSSSGGEVIYSGPAEWSYRRLILHYAKLCQLAGGVDAFLIGSELRGLSTLRSANSSYPFVAALQTLASEVKAMLPGAKISYAADWSEYFGHHASDGSGDVHFHLDPLWASASVDFVGIDNYMPLSDWRDGANHLDAEAGATSVHDLNYLKGNVAAGEGHDWYYATTLDRENQARTPITDGAYGKPWVFRFKDLKSWWLNSHRNRPGGVETGSNTPWVPQSKPFWFTELGCPAIDKGTNQPNVFVDVKSSESAVPYFSGAQRDDLMQQRYIRAQQDYWNAMGAHNPQSTEYVGSMVDSTRLFYWAWDARPFPQFPALTDVWSDGDNYALGHWLNGRAGAVDLGELIAALSTRFGLDATGTSAVAGLIDGFVLDRPMSGREALEALLNVFSIDAVESEGALAFRPRQVLQATAIPATDLVDEKPDQPVFHETRAQETDLPRAVRIGFAESGVDYRAAAVSQQRVQGQSRREVNVALPAAVNQALAQTRADLLLEEAWQQRTSAKFALPPRFLALEPGDVVALDGRSLRLGSIVDGVAREIEALSHDASLYETWPGAVRPANVQPQLHFSKPDVQLLDLALVRGVVPAPWIAAKANPWPSRLSVLRRADTASFTFTCHVPAQATMGSTTTALSAGVTDRIDYTQDLDVVLGHGALASVSLEQLLGGANIAALGSEANGFEIIQFANAALIATNTYRLTGLLRAQAGSREEMLAVRPIGTRFMLLNAAVVQPPTSLSEAARDSLWRIGPSQFDHGHEAYVERALSATMKALRPLAPVRLTSRNTGSGLELAWIRSTRVDGESWELAEVPLGEASEAYRVTILDGATIKRSVDTTAPEHFYTTAQIISDFGALPTSFTARIQQLSAAYGAGSALERIINV